MLCSVFQTSSEFNGELEVFFGSLAAFHGTSDRVGYDAVGVGFTFDEELGGRAYKVEFGA